MQFKLQNIETNTPNVFLFSAKNFFSKLIKEGLENKNCKVTEFELNKISGVNSRSLSSQLQRANYILVIAEEATKSLSVLVELLLNLNIKNAKTLICIPCTQTKELYSKNTELAKAVNNEGKECGILYFGDLVNVATFDEVSYLDFAINQSLAKRKAYLPESNYNFYPVLLSDAVGAVIGGLLSLNSTNKIRYFIGSKINAETVKDNILYKNPDVVVTQRDNFLHSIILDKTSNYKGFDLYGAIKKKQALLESVRNFNPDRKNVVAYSKPHNSRSFSIIRNLILKAIFLVIFLLILPIISHLLVTPSLVLVNKLQLRGDINLSRKLIKIADINYNISKNLLFNLSKIDQLKFFYGQYYEKSVPLETEMDFTKRLLSLSENVVLITKNSSTLVNNKNLADGIYLDLKEINKDFEILKGEGIFTKSQDINKKAIYLAKILEDRGELFGFTEPSKYLVILQDNSIKGPSGGKIEYTGTITIDRGEIGNISFSSQTDETNKALNLTDFYSNANSPIQNAGLGLGVKGVISLDKNALDKMLSIFRTREMEPETPSLKHKFETLNLLIKNSNEKEIINLAREFISLLDKKHILITFYNDSSNSSLAKLNWSGGVSSLECLNPCYKDLVGITEQSEISDTYISREIFLDLSFQTSVLKRKLTYFMENNSQQIYKSDIGLISNSDTGVAPVEIETESGKMVKPLKTARFGDFKQSIVSIEIRPKEAFAVTFLFESEVKDISEYMLAIRKAPGTDSLPTQIKLESHDKLIKSYNPPYSLTEAGTIRYNYDLDKDFLLNLFF